MNGGKAERARLRAARVEIGGRLVAVNAERHGTRRTYDAHGCECEPCRSVNRERMRRLRAEAGKPEHTRERRARAAGSGTRRKPVPVLRVCELEGCAELIPLGEGATPSMYAKVRYHSAECRNQGRAVKLSERGVSLPERQCACGCGPYLPTRAKQRFASRSCALADIQRGRPRETKVCQCGCLTEFERPAHMADKTWANRQFLDAGHRKRAPGESRKGTRREPKPVGSRDRRKPVEPKPEPRKVFDGPPPVAPWRPPAPVVARVERTVPRPSFGLTRRSA